nr:hypothetical protein [Tanacetum cinerariifolium]
MDPNAAKGDDHSMTVETEEEEVKEERKPFVKETGLLYHKDEGTIMFKRNKEKITFKMPHKMESMTVETEEEEVKEESEESDEETKGETKEEDEDDP